MAHWTSASSLSALFSAHARCTIDTLVQLQKGTWHYHIWCCIRWINDMSSTTVNCSTLCVQLFFNIFGESTDTSGAWQNMPRLMVVSTINISSFLKIIIFWAYNYMVHWIWTPYGRDNVDRVKSRQNIVRINIVVWYTFSWVIKNLPKELQSSSSRSMNPNKSLNSPTCMCG